MKFTIPGTSVYTQFISAARDIIKSVSVNSETGIGSTLYEWVARPAASVFGGLTESLNDTYTKYGLEYLSTSTATENPVADAVMSNYFITRKDGTAATALITVTSTSGTEFIPQGTKVTAGDIELSISYAYQAYISGSYEDAGDVHYVQSQRLPTGEYIYSIQAESTETTDSVIAADTPVEGLEYIGTITGAYLGSALAGGSTGETDAEMVQRAKSIMASPVGSSSTVDKLIRSFGIPILGTRSFGFGDPEMIRGTNNVLLTSTGGFVDTYVQTQNYLSTKSVKLTLTKSGSEYIGDLSTAFADCRWFYNVSSVAPEEGSVVSWSTDFSSLDNRYTPEAVRLSVLQGSTLRVKLGSISSNAVQATVSVQYMPSIGALQTMLDGSPDKPLGMSILLKAAPIVLLGISGNVKGITTESFADFYKSYIRARGVGSGWLLLSELNEALKNNVPGAYLVSPTVFTVGYVTSTDSIMNSYVTDGVVKPVESTRYGWTYRTFCYCTDDNMIRAVGNE